MDKKPTPNVNDILGPDFTAAGGAKSSPAKPGVPAAPKAAPVKAPAAPAPSAPAPAISVPAPTAAKPLPGPPKPVFTAPKPATVPETKAPSDAKAPGIPVPQFEAGMPSAATGSQPSKKIGPPFSAPVTSPPKASGPPAAAQPAFKAPALAATPPAEVKTPGPAPAPAGTAKEGAASPPPTADDMPVMDISDEMVATDVELGEATPAPTSAQAPAAAPQAMAAEDTNVDEPTASGAGPTPPAAGTGGDAADAASVPAPMPEPAAQPGASAHDAITATHAAADASFKRTVKRQISLEEAHEAIPSGEAPAHGKRGSALTLILVPFALLGVMAIVVSFISLVVWLAAGRPHVTFTHEAPARAQAALPHPCPACVCDKAAVPPSPAPGILPGAVDAATDKLGAAPPAPEETGKVPFRKKGRPVRRPKGKHAP